uniref:Uncharacterized protein n=1 Tax=Romanomermis culicivorax TaxID=13658 RepID=A0A915J090_ROMCU
MNACKYRDRVAKIGSFDKFYKRKKRQRVNCNTSRRFNETNDDRRRRRRRILILYDVDDRRRYETFVAPPPHNDGSLPCGECDIVVDGKDALSLDVTAFTVKVAAAPPETNAHSGWLGPQSWLTVDIQVQENQAANEQVENVWTSLSDKGVGTKSASFSNE